jgi:hypothetical protein
VREVLAADHAPSILSSVSCHWTRFERYLTKILGSIRVFRLHTQAKLTVRNSLSIILLASAVVPSKETVPSNGLPFISPRTTSPRVHQSSLSCAVCPRSNLMSCRGARGTTKFCGVCHHENVSRISLQYMSLSTRCCKCAGQIRSGKLIGLDKVTHQKF